ncbi:MAG TPA: RNA methyltransferase [Solirubrobacteraceae bacterium]|nr:RNA methyltransferase [Solirubrobacteraceae bacterium]
MTITSPTNQHITEIRKLARASARRESGRFVAEGEDLQEAALAARISPLYVLWARGCATAVDAGLEVAPELLARVSTLGSSTRVIGVYEQRWSAPVGPLAVALWGLRDPGNVGTIVRSAVAFGAGSVAVGPGTADPYAPKAVRASMGAIFAVRLARFSTIAELPGRIVALVPGEGRPLDGPFEGTATLLVGGERDGVPPDVVAQCHEVRHIPQVAGDSLNAAMAATVALYEATRMAAS